MRWRGADSWWCCTRLADWRAGHDIDMAVNLPIGDVAAHLTASGIKTIETGIAFGTVTVVDCADKVELTQTRSRSGF